IWDEHDEVIEEIEKLDDGSYRIVCSAGLDDLCELFDLKTDEDSDVTTVSGWVMECLGRIPAEGDQFACDGLAVTVTKTDGRRVAEIVVKKEAE
ncbi:MAG: HlyC/CorC family transporter, partial [Clostridia bacterium]|nr:HlyC/CorC family transporter [Clostridia bacterium]